MVVELSQVCKHFNQDVRALNGLDLVLNEGQVLGLFGHNGAGKTTTIKLILGLLTPTSGKVRVLGEDPVTCPQIKSALGFLPENVRFYDELTGREVLHYFAKLKGVNTAQGDELLEQFQLEHALNRPVKTYSKGMRQRLGLAQAMLGSPRLLLLDEPTVGLDPVATKQFYQQVERLKNQGCTLIICSHVLPGIEHYIDKALIMSQGHALVQGSVHDLNAQANLPLELELNLAADAHDLPAQIHGEISRSQVAGGWLIKVDPKQQVSAMGQLTQLPRLQRLLARAPSLDDLYHYYIQRSSPGVAS